MGRGGDSEAKKAFSARWSPRTLDEARARAERAGVKFNQLTERYVQEGIRMDEHPLIYFRDGVAGRRPTLLGTRLDVATVISTVRQNDNSVGEAADYLRLPVAHVEACVRYYLAFQDEIDAWIERDEEEAEAAEISWRKRQEIFS
jgi:uncharacterized protein (DUF433 family)